MSRKFIPAIAITTSLSLLLTSASWAAAVPVIHVPVPVVHVNVPNVHVNVPTVRVNTPTTNLNKALSTPRLSVVSGGAVRSGQKGPQFDKIYTQTQKVWAKPVQAPPPPPPPPPSDGGVEASSEIGFGFW
jgi:hypothetical protein